MRGFDLNFLQNVAQAQAVSWSSRKDCGLHPPSPPDMATRMGFALSAIIGRMALGLKINEVLNEVLSDLQQGLALQADLLLR